MTKYMSVSAHFYKCGRKVTQYRINIVRFCLYEE